MGPQGSVMNWISEYSANREETDVDQIGVGGAGVFEDFYKMQL